MTFWEILLELMMILMFLTRAAVLDDVLHGMHMPWGSYVWNLVKICCVWRHQEHSQRWMTLLEVWRMMDVPDWDWCPWSWLGLDNIDQPNKANQDIDIYTFFCRGNDCPKIFFEDIPFFNYQPGDSVLVKKIDRISMTYGYRYFS